MTLEQTIQISEAAGVLIFLFAAIAIYHVIKNSN